MRNYEFMVVFRSDLADLDEKKVTQLLSKLLGENAKVKELAIMGKKPLAYEISKQKEGIYVLAKLEAVALQVGEIEKKVKLGSDVLRYLLTVVD